MSGFVSCYPFLEAVVPHEADYVTGPQATMVLVLDLDVIPLQGRMPFATLWVGACEGMFRIFNGLIAGWANTEYVCLEFLGTAMISEDVLAVFGGDCLTIKDEVAVGAVDHWSWDVLVRGKTLVVSSQFASLDIEFRGPAQLSRAICLDGP
ncbi:hypothetical protein IV203_002180 [Nitzschia inconspicua]|uniref:Uncharacterized protein n=1 Tax=Nitzschia inconspicua TaxID=303405 RepID=A0A9K3PRZ9_9STRA|nr:hypothetical protein IV203_002180 [Nitzschia inconspicua]